MNSQDGELDKKQDGQKGRKDKGKKDVDDMDVDVETPPVQQTHNVHKQSVLPELEIYAYLVVLIYLIDQKRYDEVGSSTLYSACSFIMIQK